MANEASQTTCFAYHNAYTWIISAICPVQHNADLIAQNKRFGQTGQAFGAIKSHFLFVWID